MRGSDKVTGCARRAARRGGRGSDTGPVARHDATDAAKGNRNIVGTGVSAGAARVDPLARLSITAPRPRGSWISSSNRQRDGPQGGRAAGCCRGSKGMNGEGAAFAAPAGYSSVLSRFGKATISTFGNMLCRTWT